MKTKLTTVPAAIRETACEDCRLIKIHAHDGSYRGNYPFDVAQQVISAGLGYWKDGYVKLIPQAYRKAPSSTAVAELKLTGWHPCKAETSDNVRNVYSFRTINIDLNIDFDRK